MADRPDGFASYCRHYDSVQRRLQETPMADIDLGELERLLAACTQGRWTEEGWLSVIKAAVQKDADDGGPGMRGAAAVLMNWPPPNVQADARLIAAAPGALRSLIARVGMLEAALRELANAADNVGVRHFDTDTMSPEVEAMQAATLRARAALEDSGNG